MTVPARHRPGADLRRVTRLGALGVIGLGTLLLIGWALDLAGLRGSLSGARPLVVVAVLVSAGAIWSSATALERAEPHSSGAAERRLAAQSTATRVLAEFSRPAEAVPELLRAVCQSRGLGTGGNVAGGPPRRRASV